MIPKPRCGTFGIVLDPDLIMSLAPAACQRDGRYEDLVPLNGNGGDGVFSVVFRAKRTGTDTTVALKFFSDSDLYRRLAFDREGKLLSTTFQNEDSFVKTVAGREEVVVELTTAEGRKVGLPLPFIAFEWMPNGTGVDHARITLRPLRRLPCSDVRSRSKSWAADRFEAWLAA